MEAVDKQLGGEDRKATASQPQQLLLCSVTPATERAADGKEEWICPPHQHSRCVRAQPTVRATIYRHFAMHQGLCEVLLSHIFL